MRITSSFTAVVLATAALAVAGCASKTSPDLAPAAPAPVTPIAPAVTAPAPMPGPGPLTAPVITKALAERKFTYAAPGRKGTMTFYSDGTFEYDEAGKGTGTGIWQAADGKLCQARNPTGFLPKGTPSTCTPITSDGTKFTAGQMQLIPL